MNVRWRWRLLVLDILISVASRVGVPPTTLNGWEASRDALEREVRRES